MSEHKSAAHITGFYTIVGAIVGSLATAILGLALLNRSEKSNPQKSEPPGGVHQEIEFVPPPQPKVDSAPPVEAVEPKAEAIPTSITMESYFHLLEDDGVPPLEVVHQYIGKRVRWTGYFYSMDVYSSVKPRRYRILMVSEPEKFHDYLYFDQEESAEPDLRKLRKGMKFTITGVLGDLTRVDNAKIEWIDEPQ